MLTVLDVAAVFEEARDGVHFLGENNSLWELGSALRDEGDVQRLHLLEPGELPKGAEAPCRELIITRREHDGPVCAGREGQRLLLEGGALGLERLAEEIQNYLEDPPFIFQGEDVQYFGLKFCPGTKTAASLLTPFSMELTVTLVGEAPTLGQLGDW